MKLEIPDISPMFSSTMIPDIFFSDYLPEATGESIKIYLYILFLSKYDKSIQINELSKKLNIPVKIVQDSFKYLEEQNLLTKKNSDFILNNIQEITLHKTYKPRTALTSEQIQKSVENQYRAKAIEHINNKYFSGLMPTTWYPDIDMWFDKYSFDEQVMIALFDFCYAKSALHKAYINRIAETWSSQKVKSFSDLDAYYEKQDKIKIIAKAISNKLRLNRQLTEYEFAYIEKWSIDFGYDLPIIEIALKQTTGKSNPSFNYIDQIISSWNERNLKTIEEIKQFLIEIKQKNKNIKNLEKNNTPKNFTPQDFGNLDNLYANNDF